MREIRAKIVFCSAAPLLMFYDYTSPAYSVRVNTTLFFYEVTSTRFNMSKYTSTQNRTAADQADERVGPDDNYEKSHRGEDLRALELKVAYNERLNQELSDQVYELHREVASLKRALKTLKDNLERRDEDGLQIGPADEPPPHY